MPEDTLVTAAEIARLANVGRAAVGNWRKRYSDFPEPVTGPGSSPAFRLVEVERWLRRQRKLSDSEPADALWLALNAGRHDTDALELVADVATHLRNPLAAELPNEIRHLLDDLTELPLDDLVESLTGRVLDRQQRQHLVTPTDLARLMVELTAPVIGTVFDPACGAGNILRAAGLSGADRLVGQEIHSTLARLARARLAEPVPADIATGDALRADAFTDLQADAVVCDPPFGYRDWGHDELGMDPRWEYGYPLKGEPELAWVQHCLAHVKPGGSVVLALPAGVAFRRSGRVIRQALLRRGVVRAVIALPAGVLMSTGIPIHLWVLRKPDSGGVGPVLLMDMSHHQPSRRGQVDWPALRDEVVDAWREFGNTGTVKEVSGTQQVFEPIHLLDQDVDLTPARHLPQPQSTLDPRTLERTRQDLARLLEELGGLLPEFSGSRRGPQATTTINDLARAGALVVRQHVGPLPVDEAGSGPPVLTGRDVVIGSEPEGRFGGTDEHDPIHLIPGDLVVPLVVVEQQHPNRVIDTDGLVLGPGLTLIRVDPKQLDVHFLAAQIRVNSDARSSSTTSSGSRRIDLRRIEVPVLDLDRQRQLGAAFQRLDAFQSKLRVAASLGADLAHQLTEGLARGAVEPPE
ncbi:type II restriction endonuclease subunit M [Lentzea sp. NBRC 102530]|nr:type II restriction endonuclease subunit M [Lentzea sp. NBRC 102530]